MKAKTADVSYKILQAEALIYEVSSQFPTTILNVANSLT